ncbi:MAG: GNAT family N-acetyltransferase [Candidatus Woesearchaeota archaeon]
MKKDKIKIILKTKRLLLRIPEIKDAKYYPEIYNDKEASAFTHVPYPYTLKDAKDFIKKIRKIFGKQAYDFVIVVKETRKVIGAISIVKINKRDNRAELAYYIAKQHRNKGYITEAGKEIIKFAFEKLKFNRLNINHVKGNKQSEKVILKLGAKYEGIEKKAVLTGDKKYKDHLLYGLLADEWKKSRIKIKNSKVNYAKK